MLSTRPVRAATSSGAGPHVSIGLRIASLTSSAMKIWLMTWRRLSRFIAQRSSSAEAASRSRSASSYLRMSLPVAALPRASRITPKEQSKCYVVRQRRATNMAKLGKLDRMGVSGSTLGEESLEDVKDGVAEAMTALETFEEQRNAAVEAFTEAASHHEERDWESRDSALDEAQSAVEEMSVALEEIESQSEFVNLPDGRMETIRKMLEDVREHLGHLI